MDFNRSVSVQGSSAGVAPGAVVSGVLAGASGHSLYKVGTNARSASCSAT